MNYETPEKMLYVIQCMIDETDFLARAIMETDDLLKFHNGIPNAVPSLLDVRRDLITLIPTVKMYINYVNRSKKA